MQRIDIVGIFAKRLAQCRNRFVFAPGPQVIERERDLQATRILLEPCFERRVRLVTAPECGE